MSPYLVKEKLVISGNYFEHYKYSRPYWVGFPRVLSFREKSFKSKRLSQKEIRDDNIRRTRIKIRRLVNSNPDLVKFMTLTFTDNITSLSLANSCFVLIIYYILKMVFRKCGSLLKYF